MPQRKIDIDDVRIGMYVEALDRPWLESDYELVGVKVENDHDIERLRSQCEYVMISANEPPPALPRSGQEPGNHPVASRHGNNRAGTEAAAQVRTSRTFAEEIKVARQIHQNGRALMLEAEADVRRGIMPSTGAAEDLVSQMMDSVARHPEALVWFTTLKNRDEYTALHSMNVCMLAITLISSTNAEESTVRKVGLGALLHDIGKIRVPLDILNKPGRLTPAEFAEMRRHPEYGVEILADSEHVSNESLEMVRSHHERLDGSGYGRGLAGSQISRVTQLLSVVDVYDAMTTERVYHMGRSPVDVLQEMRKASHSLNLEFVDLFRNCLGQYPVGTLVELNTGEVGFVVPGSTTHEKPVVMVVLDHNKRRLFPQRVRDLRRFDRFHIVNSLASGGYGIDVEDFAELFE